MATIKQIQQSILEKLIKFGDSDENDIIVYLGMLVAIDKIMAQNDGNKQAAWFKQCMNVGVDVFNRFKFANSERILTKLAEATKDWRQ